MRCNLSAEFMCECNADANLNLHYQPCFLTLALKICILHENGFKELTLVLFESIYWSTTKP